MNLYKFNSLPLNNQWIKKEITREIKKYLDTSENEKNIQKIMIRGVCMGEGNYKLRWGP